MKKIIFIFLLFIPICVYSEEIRFDFGSLNLFLTTKLLKDGYITDFGFGIMYNDKFGGEFKLRNTFTSKNEELENVADSLNAIKEDKWEFFLFPIKYYFFKKPQLQMWTGIGINYQYSKLNEKGFFNMPVLEQLTPPRERVNSYTNDFSMHTIGPLADFNILYRSNLFNITLSGGIVPIFFLASSQNTRITPLLDPNHVDYKQNTWGSPYMYVGLDSILFKYLNVLLLYDFFRANFKEIDFDENLNWITPEKNINTQSLKIETSILIPISKEMRFQIGYGFALNARSVNKSSFVTENKHYFILTARKSGE
jgi:hypothetical protein